MNAGVLGISTTRSSRHGTGMPRQCRSAPGEPDGSDFRSSEGPSPDSPGVMVWFSPKPHPSQVTCHNHDFCSIILKSQAYSTRDGIWGYCGKRAVYTNEYANL